MTDSEMKDLVVAAAKEILGGGITPERLETVRSELEELAQRVACELTADEVVEAHTRASRLLAAITGEGVERQ